MMPGALGWIALFVAVGANIAANISLRHAVHNVHGGKGMTGVMTGLATSPAAWLGFFFAALLLAAYMTAIRILPLGVCYVVVTSFAMAGLTLWGGMTGAETITWMRGLGLVLVAVGITAIVASA